MTFRDDDWDQRLEILRIAAALLFVQDSQRHGVEPPGDALAARDRVRRSLRPNDWRRLEQALEETLDVLTAGLPAADRCAAAAP